MAEEPLKLPKMDYKMLIMGGMMLGSRQIDFKKIENVALAQQIFYAVIIAILSIYFILYQLVERKKDTTIIWVPPKPTPALPFGPQPEPVKPSDYQKTTVYEHEVKLLKEGAMSAVTSGAIAIGMSLKFNIHASLVMQARSSLSSKPKTIKLHYYFLHLIP